MIDKRKASQIAAERARNARVERIELRVPPEVLAALDEARGTQSRNEWLVALIRAAVSP